VEKFTGNDFIFAEKEKSEKQKTIIDRMLPEVPMYPGTKVYGYTCMRDDHARWLSGPLIAVSPRAAMSPG
jgi:hypothetical protein